jgi:transposase
MPQTCARNLSSRSAASRPISLICVTVSGRRGRGGRRLRGDVLSPLKSQVQVTDGHRWSYHEGMRPHGSQTHLEARRRRAVALLKQGHGPVEVARRVGCAHSSVVRWRQAVEQHGLAGLTAKPVPGCPPKLTARQKQQIPKLLLRGARAWGFHTDLWTTPRIADVIERTFGVRYHPTHVGRLLAQWGWSCQQPARRALERDEAAIRHWTDTVWPRIKKKPIT